MIYLIIEKNVNYQLTKMTFIKIIQVKVLNVRKNNAILTKILKQGVLIMLTQVITVLNVITINKKIMNLAINHVRDLLITQNLLNKYFKNIKQEIQKKMIY